jgi:hypothetical protein
MAVLRSLRHPTQAAKSSEQNFPLSTKQEKTPATPPVPPIQSTHHLPSRDAATLTLSPTKRKTIRKTFLIKLFTAARFKAAD